MLGARLALLGSAVSRGSLAAPPTHTLGAFARLQPFSTSLTVKDSIFAQEDLDRWASYEDRSQAGQVFAVVELGGRQYKVTQDDIMIVEKLKRVDVNSILNLHNVMLFGSKEFTIVGRPYVGNNASVTVRVEEQTKAPKVWSYKHKPRKGYQRLVGHRQPKTVLRVLKLGIPSELKPEVTEPSADAEQVHHWCQIEEERSEEQFSLIDDGLPRGPVQTPEARVEGTKASGDSVEHLEEGRDTEQRS